MQNKIKILIADDIETLVNNMKQAISKNSRVEEIITAIDGEDATNKILNLKPDLVFIDNQMPKKTGIEVIETIKVNSNVIKQPKFILVTGDRDSKLVVKARELKFDIEYKPIEPERLNEYIDNFGTNIRVIETSNPKGFERNNKTQKDSFLKKIFRHKL